VAALEDGDSPGHYSGKKLYFLEKNIAFFFARRNDTISQQE
jgi:hypothetical protein